MEFFPEEKVLILGLKNNVELNEKIGIVNGKDEKNRYSVSIVKNDQTQSDNKLLIEKEEARSFHKNNLYSIDLLIKWEAARHEKIFNPFDEVLIFGIETRKDFNLKIGKIGEKVKDTKEIGKFRYEVHFKDGTESIKIRPENLINIHHLYENYNVKASEELLNKVQDFHEKEKRENSIPCSFQVPKRSTNNKINTIHTLNQKIEEQEKLEQQKQFDEILQRQKHVNIVKIDTIRNLKDDKKSFEYFTNQENGYEFHLVQPNPNKRGYFIWKKRFELIYTINSLQYIYEIEPLEKKATEEEVKMFWNPSKIHKTKI